MYAVAFDLVVAKTQKHHPKGVTQAYTEIGAVLGLNRYELTHDKSSQAVLNEISIKPIVNTQ